MPQARSPQGSPGMQARSPQRCRRLPRPDALQVDQEMLRPDHRKGLLVVVLLEVEVHQALLQKNCSPNSPRTACSATTVKSRGPNSSETEDGTRTGFRLRVTTSAQALGPKATGQTIHSSKFKGQSWNSHLECTALGVVFTKADVVCEYVTILAPTTEKAEVQFAVEGVTPISKVLQFEMSDGEPRLLVGTPTKSGDGSTLLAGRSFRVKTTDVEIYAKEMLAAHETLQGDKILPVPQKRAADSMIQETPSKKFAPAFLVQ